MAPLNAQDGPTLAMRVGPYVSSLSQREVDKGPMVTHVAGWKWLALGAACAVAVSIPVAVVAKPAVGNWKRCRDVHRYLAANGPVQTVGTGRLRVAVLGDSYTSGEELPDRSDRWVTTFAALANATVRFDAVGRTGFTNGGFCGGMTFASRADALGEDRPDLYVIQGGINDDTAPSTESLAEGVERTVAGARGAGRIVILGPSNAPARESVTTDSELSRIAQRLGVEYVSTIEWDLPFLPDNLHLTREGHEQYAAAVAAALALP